MPDVTPRWLRWVLPVRRRPAVPAPVPGVHPFRLERDGREVRVQLRVEPAGHGVLLVHARAAVPLSQPGVQMAEGILRGEDDDDVIRRIRSAWGGASGERIRADLATLRQTLDALVEGADPRFPLAGFGPTATDLRFPAPLVADVTAGAPERMVPLLRRLWEGGVPIVVIRDHPAASPAWLLRAIERAEDLGLVALLRTPASRLAEGDLLADLADSGLDGLVLPFASADPALHDACWGAGDHATVRAVAARAHEREVPWIAEVPLLDASDPEAVLERVETEAGKGMAVFALAADPVVEPPPIDAQPALRPLAREALHPVAAAVEALFGRGAILWTAPVRVPPGSSVADLVRAGPRTLALESVRVEHDGNVVPPRGPYVRAGNVLRDPWDALSSHPSFAPGSEPCADCPGLCRTGCPADPATWTEQE
ncbi:MAG: hypothetical protein JXB39_04215 [Deltaproteobacteria bacterium]|nr:hypothetical protein [Deltaproteobacteria bacterium]